MKFFATTESYKSVSKKIIKTQNIISKRLNELLVNKNYGEGVSDWGYISIVNPPEFYAAGFFKEIKKYIKNQRDIDIRLKVDYESVLDADEQELFKLICNSILISVNIAENELKVEMFDFREFKKDLTSLFNKEGWL